ncbi:hypothetical protein [Bordetella genomosp. 9]|uniref:hypothetical protein n=1 Tax=Bordetella genomosp. 9 TaxID=1416803 RepID=UPI0012FB6141|nr:hypothetical protein [Bordetella genomosp. 9]
MIDKESQLAGQPRSRAWAEKWIERQFDFGKVEANLKPNQPYFTPKWPHAAGRAVTNTNGTDMGSAAFFGSQSDIQANGVFDIKFSGNSDRLYYTVENKTTGEVTGPRPYDSHGTVIKANGLRAEMFGTPKPGDFFMSTSRTATRVGARTMTSSIAVPRSRRKTRSSGFSTRSSRR